MRSCYQTEMQFDEAGTIVAEIVYYFAPDGAKTIEGENLYHSTNWDQTGDVSLGIGEVWNSPKGWVNGAMPCNFTGQHRRCGKHSWWREGVPTGTPPLQMDANGCPLCCQPPVVTTSSGGILLGGAAALCQPWHVFLPTNPRSITRLATGVVWPTVLNTTNAYKAQDPLNPTTSIGGGALGSCLGFNSTTLGITFVSGGTPGTSVMNLQTWNPATNIGIWQCRPGTPYPNEYFAFYSSLT